VSDRKRKKRLHISKDVYINRTLRAEGLDLSADGMYIYTRHPYVEGSIIEVGFRLDGKEIEVLAKVVHSQPGIGCGVHFMTVREEVSEKIKDYVERLGTETKGNSPLRGPQGV